MLYGPRFGGLSCESAVLMSGIMGVIRSETHFTYRDTEINDILCT